MAKKKKTPKKIFMPELVSVDQLVYDDENTNRQDKKTFELLVDNIDQEGFDEPCIVIPTQDSLDDGRPVYKVVHGNHRAKGAIRNGYTEVSAIIRDDWDDTKAATQAYRRNFSRGEVDPLAYQNLVKHLEVDEGLSSHEAMKALGIHDEAVYTRFLEEEFGASSSNSKVNDAAEKDEEALSNRIKLIDNIGLIVSEIVERYGDTIIYSFLIFPASGRKHMYVQSSPALKAVLTRIATECVSKGEDLAGTLAALLNVGIAHTNYAPGREVPETDSEFTEIDLGDIES